MKSLLFTIPLIGGVTGWFILSIALKLLFRPREPVRLWGDIFFHGLIPGKQAQLASGIREILETQLLYAVSKDMGAAQEVFYKITDTTARSVRQRTEQKLPAILPSVVRERIAAAVEDIVRREAPGFIETIIENIRKENDDEQDFCRILEEKIRYYDTNSLERSVFDSREVFYLKAGGTVIGFMAGLLQLLVVWIAAA